MMCGDLFLQSARFGLVWRLEGPVILCNILQNTSQNFKKMVCNIKHLASTVIQIGSIIRI